MNSWCLVICFMTQLIHPDKGKDYPEIYTCAESGCEHVSRDVSKESTISGAAE